MPRFMAPLASNQLTRRAFSMFRTSGRQFESDSLHAVRISTAKRATGPGQTRCKGTCVFLGSRLVFTNPVDLDVKRPTRRSATPDSREVWFQEVEPHGMQNSEILSPLRTPLCSPRIRSVEGPNSSSAKCSFAECRKHSDRLEARFRLGSGWPPTCPEALRIWRKISSRKGCLPKLRLPCRG